MKTLNRATLKPLIEHDQYPSMSVYLPTHPTFDEVREDPIRFKNLVMGCEHKLRARYAKEKVQKMLKPAFDLLHDTGFWKYQSRGLAVFMSDNFMRHFNLSVSPDETARVDTYFYVLPLVADVMYDRTYYILDLNLNDIALLEVYRDRVQRVELPDIPSRIEELLQYEELEKQPQFRTVPEGKIDGADAIFHGHGSMADDDRRKRVINDYLVKIAKHIDRRLDGMCAPLVLAGDDYNQTLYRRHSNHPHILEKGIPRQNDPTALRSMQKRAEQVVEPVFNKAIEESIERYRGFAGTGKVSGDIVDVLPAAFNGRIDTLLVDPSQSVFGRFDPASQTVELTPKERQESDADELINLAVLCAWRNGAQVYPASGQELDTPAAALFRY